MKSRIHYCRSCLSTTATFSRINRFIRRVRTRKLIGIPCAGLARAGVFPERFSSEMLYAPRLCARFGARSKVRVGNVQITVLQWSTLSRVRRSSCTYTYACLFCVSRSFRANLSRATQFFSLDKVRRTGPLAERQRVRQVAVRSSFIWFVLAATARIALPT